MTFYEKLFKLISHLKLRLKNVKKMIARRYTIKTFFKRALINESIIFLKESKITKESDTKFQILTSSLSASPIMFFVMIASVVCKTK